MGFIWDLLTLESMGNYTAGGGEGGTVKEQAVITFSINKRTMKHCVIRKPAHDQKQNWSRIQMGISVFQLPNFFVDC